MESLAERRMRFVYEAARLAGIAANAPIVPEPIDQRDPTFITNMTNAVEKQCGSNRHKTPKDAHDAWWDSYISMGWEYGTVRNTKLKTHPDMVPYEELGQLERDKDEVYMALCDIARQWIKV